MDAWIGRTLSKVRIERPLGRGGMAEVYLGRHTTLDRPVAVKILHGHLQEDSDLRRRFEAEAQSVAALRHPNIVQVFDFDVVEDRPYIIMELLRGMSLGEYLKTFHKTGVTLPVRTVSHLINGLAAALDYAHQRGIVHRDVKPANIMLREGDQEINPSSPLPPNVEPVLTDFGVARLAHSTAQTATGTVLGTPAYMSPEQVRGERIDSRSDIYSLGIVLYELLAGEVPFDHETTPAAVLVKHLNEEPAPIPQASPAVQDVVKKALTKSAEGRYQQAGELASALERAAGGTVPAPRRRRARPQPERKSRSIPQGCWIVGGLAAAGFFVIMLVAGFLGLRALGGPPASRPTQATAVSVDAPATAARSPTAAALDPSQPVGRARIQATNLDLALSDVPAPPPGSSHRVWLQAEDGGLQPLGLAQQSEDQLTFSYTHPSPLIPVLGSVLISLEPADDPNPDQPGQIQYEATLDEGTAGRLALVTDVRAAENPVQEVPAGLEAQITHYSSHLQFSLEAIRSGNLEGGKLHSEHVINIVEGREGTDYADWNGDGRLENPGDDVGLLPYLQLMESLISASEGETDPALENVRALIDRAERARDLATRVASADTLEEVTPLAEELSGLQFEPEVRALLDQTAGLDLGLSLPVFPAPSP